MDTDKRLYNDFNRYLRRIYGEKVSRIPIDAGFSCPNRENNNPGCIYCLEGSASASSDRKKPVIDQIREYREKALSKKKPVKTFIAYYQAYTNTYADCGRLKEVFSPVNGFDDIKAVAIGTRPDCIDEEKLTCIKKTLKDKDIWMEYGLQSVNTKTLEFIQRGHGKKAFQKAADLTRKHGIKVCAHVILGFPWENEKDVTALSRFLSACKIDFLKIHVLHVLKNTPLERLYKKNKIILPSLENYVRLAADLIERLPSTIVIQRLTGEGTKTTHMAPDWGKEKTKVLEAINRELEKRNSFQGKLA